MAVFILLLAGLPGVCSGQKIPEVHGTTFAGVTVDLPDALRGKVGVLVIGFSQGSRDAITVWGKKMAGAYDDSPAVTYYEMPMLASVPKLLRGWVTGKIKSSVSDRGKPHFLPLNEKEDEWKALTHYKSPDDAYLLVVDEQGVVRWQMQGPPTDEAFAAMKQKVEALRPGQARSGGAQGR